MKKLIINNKQNSFPFSDNNDDGSSSRPSSSSRSNGISSRIRNRPSSLSPSSSSSQQQQRQRGQRVRWNYIVVIVTVIALPIAYLNFYTSTQVFDNYYYSFNNNNNIDSDNIPVPKQKDQQQQKRENAVSSSSFSTSAQYVLSQSIDVKKCKFHKPSSSEPIVQQSNNTTSNSVIVTAYFRIKSKYKSNKYDQWMNYFLSLQDNVIIFTQPEMVATIRGIRHKYDPHNNRTVIIEMSLGDLPIAKLTGPSSSQNSTLFWLDQLENKDVERKIHQSYQVFWIWLSKTWFVDQAITHPEINNLFNGSLFVWSDIGCFRNTMYNEKRIVQYPEIVPLDKILWMAHRTPAVAPYKDTDNYPLFVNKLAPKTKHYFYHSGSQAAGYADTWKQYHHEFSVTIDQFLNRQYFIGEDQCVLQSTCLRRPNLCQYIKHNQVRDNHYFGLRYVLHHGPNSAINNSPNKQYEYWSPPTPPPELLPTTDKQG